MKNSYAILVALFIVATTFAQAPEQMRYQSIVRDATGSLVTNQQVGMQISILQTTVGGTAVYVETQTPITNANGLVSIAIGTGTPVNGTFATIAWSADTYFIKTETDPTGSTSYSIIGTSQLLSVPYALHAKTVATAITAANGIPAGGTQDQVLQIVAGVPTWIDATFSVFYKDTDGDSYGDINSIIATSGVAPNGYVANNTDCNDGDATMNPTAVWYIDADADGYGSSSIVACERPINGYLLSEIVGSGTDDCNDGDPLVNNTNQTWYIDGDGDGYGGSSVVACARVINGFLLSELSGNGTDDCDDTDPDEYPGQTWYIDLDGDNFGGSSVVACARVINGFLLSELSGNGTDDCDDTDPDEYPGQTWYIDADGDNFGGSSVVACARVINGLLLSELLGSGTDDCNDGDATINPSQSEIYGDGIDNNCDGAIDEIEIGQIIDNDGVVFYIASTPTDLDGDGDLDNGLVVAITDQSANIQWYNGAYIVTGATGIAIGTGASNTNAIIAAQGATATNYAAGIARAYNGGGFNDWFLPSKDELRLISIHKAAINATILAHSGVAFGLGSYWSSTDYVGPFAWRQLSNSVNQANGDKASTYFVRAVRAF